MYTPKHFAMSDAQLSHEMIHRYSFATLISISDGTPMISHLPFLFDPFSGKQGTLFAHMARANPQWRGFDSDANVTVVFQGPHAYISPRWYQPQLDNVPTWNYAVVHVHGLPRVIREEEASFEVMQRLVQQHDPDWKLVLSEQNRREMMREIVAFEIEIKRLETTFKLSQNRSDADAERVAAELLGSNDQLERETGELMQRLRRGERR